MKIANLNIFRLIKRLNIVEVGNPRQTDHMYEKFVIADRME